jgi:PPM family protein phosphatase
LRNGARLNGLLRLKQRNMNNLPVTMGYNVAYYMNIGLRENQEDCIFINGKIFQQKKFNEIRFKRVKHSKGIFAVCDGMGGHSKGEWASRFVCEKLKDYLREFIFSGDFIQCIFQEIQTEIKKEAVKNYGTTVAFVALDGINTTIFNVGDSRVYKITRDDIVYLSHDHSFVQSMIDSGDLSQSEAFHHPFKNVIEFGIGDVFKTEWVKNGKRGYIKDDVLNKDEYYLICTDGVNDVLRDKEIYNILYPDPFDKFPEFVEHLKETMKDNLSVIIIGKM